ncbi:hypothetical protein M3Y97_01106300 [Aphelenchoides bicaudatus]|nr:hypothetical protein M3Y97_01106300 [Aphelenchoides bicaudatus]
MKSPPIMSQIVHPPVSRRKISVQQVANRQTDWRTIYTLTLVGFLSSLHMGSMNFWAYMTQLDSTITPVFYGYLLSIGSCGHVITTVISGYVSNRISYSTPSLVAGKVSSIFGSLCFLSIELFKQNLRVVLLFMTLLFGLSMGLMSVMRAQISSSTSEADRPRAVSFLSLAMTCGIAVGPLISSILTLVKYPGYEYFPGLHLNLYTIPIYLMLMFGIFTLILLLGPNFRGVLKEAPVEVKSKFKELASTTERPHYDSLAVGICCFTRITIGLSMVYFQTINGPYLMAAFHWKNEEYVRFSSLLRVMNGLTGIALSLSFIFGCMQKWISPRQGIVAAVSSKLLFYIITYPWPFLQSTMTYEVTGLNALNETIILQPGCKEAMTWCETTPAINVYIYCVAEIVCLGFSLPMMALNLEILYATVLGGIKQGTMQGIFVVSGDLLHILGPVVLATLYETSGPTAVWIVMIASNGLVLVIWIIFYKRMIPYSKMLEGKLSQVVEE